MEKRFSAHIDHGCGRQEELVTYLYGEATPAERTAFERHLEECAGCRGELQAFGQVRHDLSAWQVPFAPRIEIAPRRGKLEVLGELLGLFPVWARVATALAMAAAVVIVVLAGIGARISSGKDGLPVSFGRAQTVENSRAVAQPVTQQVSAPQADLITRAEAEAMVKDAVARVQAQAQNEARAQLAGLETRLSAAHEARLKAVSAQLRAERRAELAQATKQQMSLREWLFAANDGKDGFGTEDEKNY